MILRLCKLLRRAIDHDGPVYMRFGRLAVEDVNSEDYKFELGKGVQLKDGKDATIIATGLMVGMALEAAKMLEERRHFRKSNQYPYNQAYRRRNNNKGC